MGAKSLLSLVLLLAWQARSAPVLGLDYSEAAPAYTTRIALDRLGFIYILSIVPASENVAAASIVTKLSRDGKKVVWQNQLGISVSTMTVDPEGEVYITPFSLTNAGTISFTVAKLNSNGSGVAWTSTRLPESQGSSPLLAVDPSGRTYVAFFAVTGIGQVIRLKAGGAVIDYSSELKGRPTSLAVDSKGSAFIAGIVPLQSEFLMRFTPDGLTDFLTVTTPQQDVSPTVVLEAVSATEWIP